MSPKIPLKSLGNNAHKMVLIMDLHIHSLGVIEVVTEVDEKEIIEGQGHVVKLLPFEEIYDLYLVHAQ